MIPNFIVSSHRVFFCPAVLVNLNAAMATPSVSFLAGQQNPSPLWMQTSFTSVLRTFLDVFSCLLFGYQLILKTVIPRFLLEKRRKL
jgi:hypothetical protein